MLLKYLYYDSVKLYYNILHGFLNRNMSLKVITCFETIFLSLKERNVKHRLSPHNVW